MVTINDQHISTQCKATNQHDQLTDMHACILSDRPCAPCFNDEIRSPAKHGARVSHRVAQIGMSMHHRLQHWG